MPRLAVRAPFGGLAETGAGGVRRLLVPILLNGGFGYENYLRFRSPLAVDHRLRSFVGPCRCRAAWRHGGQLSPCNVERLSENRYQISLAVAGFSPDEITITAEQNVYQEE